MAEPWESYEERPAAEPVRASRVLWGRVAVLGGALLFAFLLGRATAPEGVSQAEFSQLKTELADERDRVRSLESQPAPTQQTAPTPAPSPVPSPEGESQSYVVQSGDTLGSIALRFYGNSSLAWFLAETNGITDVRKLPVGKQLVIPPKPSD